MIENNDTPLSKEASAKFIGVSTPTFRKVLAGDDRPESTQVGEREKFRPSKLRSWLETKTHRFASGQDLESD